ncbi:DEAD/DEAH box helicase [Salinibius halmophilus]|uniref:DEAD/DEAH box helicase n=1 Tax=Salinibius halmophilus TaxID=1853216 RepID=UPI000E66A1E5|nr:DEAD/DEAH box helicase [Salinibius halmophilus]
MEIAQLRRNFEIRDFQTGRALQQRQHVQQMNVTVQSPSPLHVQLVGVVEHKQQTHYPHMSLVMVNDRLHVDGDCDCGGYNCAHIAAMAIHYVVQVESGHIAPPNPEAALASWLEQFPSAPAARPHKIVFSLSVEEGDLLLSAMVLKRKQNGSLGKRLHQLTEEVFAQCKISDLDRQMLALINEHERLQFDRRSKIKLHGEKGGLLLDMASQQPMVAWAALDQPASFLQPADPEWHWQSYRDGFRLENRLPAHWQLTDTYPVYAFDANSQQVIPLNEQRTYDQLVAMRSAPLVPQDKMIWLRQQLPQALVDIELPDQRPVEKRQALPFTPVLTISRTHPRAPNHVIAQLTARYEDISLAINGEQVSRIEQDDKIIEIARQRQAEQQAIDHLLSLNLHLSEFKGEAIFWHQPPQQDDDPEFWKAFLSTQVAQLVEAGWDVEVDVSAYQYNLTQRSQFDWQLAEDDEGWFDLSISFRDNDHEIDLIPLLHQLIKQPELLQQPTIAWQYQGAAVDVDSTLIEPIVATLQELAEQSKQHSIKVKRAQLPLLADLTDTWQGSQRVAQLKKELSQPLPAKVSTQLQASLRDYQVQGLQWLQQLERAGFNGLLADDMGLGKTLQIIAHICANEARTLPVLVVAPTSLLSNWRSELEKFAPHLNCAVWHGGDRHEIDIAQQDVVITTYTMARVDGEILQAQPWHYLVVDEAQQVKNHRSLAAKALRLFSANQIIALSGTPVENHLKELWAIFDLLEPGLLGNQRQFSQYFSKPIKAGEPQQWHALQQRIRPFILRRLKREVAKSLPAKTEMVRYVNLQGEQAQLYENIRLSMQDEVSKLLAQQGGRGQLQVLDALLKLRQVCCHPKLVNLEAAQQVNESAKLDYLESLLANLLEDGRKVLVFSQFAKMLDVIGERLSKLGIAYQQLTGETRNRDEQIDGFKAGKANVFLISLKAGGVGLNLTEADAVIHYDPWWNPASESQASDRAHRIGQDKPVFVYKLIVEHSVEDRILRLQHAKQQLAEKLYDSPTIDSTNLEALLQPLPAE